MPRWLSRLLWMVAQAAIATVLLALAMSAGAPSAYAQEPTAAMILASPEGTEGAAYLRGMKHGMEWLLSSKGMTNSIIPYCVPPDLPVPTQQFRQILEKQVAREPADGGKPAGLVLLKGLRQAYPCPAK